MCIVSAWVLRCIRWRQIAVALILVQCVINVLPIATGFPFKGRHVLRWTLSEYVQGISHSYTDRFAGVLDFLNKEAREGQSVLVLDPEFPLIFYTPLKIIDARLVGADETNTTMPWPDWILSQSASGLSGDQPIQPSDDVKAEYETIIIYVPNSTRGGSIPEPDLYQYHTAQSRSQFILFKKRIGSVR